MNIIKSFEVENPGQLSIEWGLGDDGELYYRYFHPRREKVDGWEIYDGRDVPPIPGFKLMRKIVKEFGHLVVFT